MRVLVTGATGTAGAAAVRQALASPGVERVTALTRRPLKIADARLDIVLVPDFMDLAPTIQGLPKQDAVLWCLGVSQTRVTREELHRITVDMVLAGAKALQAANANVRFCHLSGGGADPTGKARMPFAIEKGKAENGLDALGLAGLWHFRPNYINPPTMPERPLVGDRILRPLVPVLRLLAPNALVDADVLGRAMVRVAREGSPKKVLLNADIRSLGKAAPADTTRQKG